MIFQTSATNFFQYFFCIIFDLFVHGRKLSKYLGHMIFLNYKC